MTEIIHYINRWGGQENAVIDIPGQYKTPAGKQYARRYATGELRPYYPVPVCLRDAPPTAFAVAYMMILIKELMQDWAGEPDEEAEHPSTCTCEVCRAWGA